MTAPLHDGQLVASYVKDGAESAFRALVARHVDMVFATALRQTGDRGLAEEITQNAFIALARKAPRLTGCETLAGWLHRTTVLESRARVRAELRRARREGAAAEIAAVERDGDSLIAPLLPLLDEALLTLRENDRRALLARFFEGKSFREVGGSLGLDEEAARKRVSRALERLNEFFRQRGFALPSAGLAAVFSTAAQAAPPALASTAVQAGLSAGGAAGLHLILLNLMALSKTKTIVACAVLAAAPVLWQTKTEGEINSARSDLAGMIAAEESRLASLAGERQQLLDGLHRATGERLAAERLLATAGARQTSEPGARYEWNDALPVARLPKTILEAVQVPSLRNGSGALNAYMAEVIQLTPFEEQALQGLVNSLFASVLSAQERSLRFLPSDPDDPGAGTLEEERRFELGDTSEVMRSASAELFAQAEDLLGGERFAIFKKGLADFMPLEEPEYEARGMRTSELLTPEAQQVTFRPPNVQQLGQLSMRVELKNGSFSKPVAFDQIPAIFEPYLRDWIDHAREITMSIEQAESPAQP